MMSSPKATSSKQSVSDAKKMAEFEQYYVSDEASRDEAPKVTPKSSTKKSKKSGASFTPVNAAAVRDHDDPITKKNPITGRPPLIGSILAKSKIKKIEKKPASVQPSSSEADDDEDETDVSGGRVAAKVTATPSSKKKTKVKSEIVDDDDGDQKKEAKHKLPHDYKGRATDHGTAENAPDNADLDDPWNCGNVVCNSGMTFYYRDTPHDGKKVDAYGRKCISDMFGRNKASTKTIPNDVWHMMCRKDYQRTKYGKDNEKGDKAATARWRIENLRDQLVRLKLWRPDAKFDVQLSGAAQKRLAEYNKFIVQKGDSKTQAALKLKSSGKDEQKQKDEERFPIALQEEFDRDQAMTDATYEDLEAIVVWLEGKIDAGEAYCTAPREFLIQDAAEDEIVNDSSRNYYEWLQKRNEPAVSSTSSNATSDDTSADDKGKSKTPATETAVDTGEDVSKPATKRRPLKCLPGGKPISSTKDATPGSGKRKMELDEKYDETESESESEDAAATPSKRPKLEV